MDVKCPLISDRDGYWKYQIADKYYKISDIISSVDLYNDRSMLTDAVAAFKNAQFTGELSDDSSNGFIAKINEKILLLNSKDVYNELISYANSIEPSAVNSPDRIRPVLDVVNKMYKTVFGTYKFDFPFDLSSASSISVDGVISQPGSSDYTSLNFISLNEPTNDLIRLAEDLAKAFYTVRGGEINKTDAFLDKIKSININETDSKELPRLFNSPDTSKDTYIVHPKNELNTDSCYLLGSIVAQFLDYADKLSRYKSNSSVDDVTNDSEYFGSVFASNDYEMMTAIRDDVKYYSDSKLPVRVLAAADAIYPVVDMVKDYILGAGTKDFVEGKINNLNDLVKQGDIRIAPVSNAERN